MSNILGIIALVSLNISYITYLVRMYGPNENFAFIKTVICAVGCTALCMIFSIGPSITNDSQSSNRSFVATLTAKQIVWHSQNDPNRTPQILKDNQNGTFEVLFQSK